MVDFKAGDVVSVEFFGRPDGSKHEQTYHCRATVQSVSEPFDGNLLVTWADGSGSQSVSASRCYNRPNAQPHNC